jgi:hypothetical protein
MQVTLKSLEEAFQFEESKQAQLARVRALNPKT